MSNERDTMTIDFTDRIDQGVSYLDEAVGTDWPALIVMEKLNLRSTCSCVLGQLAPQVMIDDIRTTRSDITAAMASYRTWIKGGNPPLDTLRETKGWPSMTPDEAEVRGFVLTALEDRVDSNWTVLTKLWAERIDKLVADRGLAFHAGRDA